MPRYVTDPRTGQQVYVDDAGNPIGELLPVGSSRSFGEPLPAQAVDVGGVGSVRATQEPIQETPSGFRKYFNAFTGGVGGPTGSGKTITGGEAGDQFLNVGLTAAVAASPAAPLAPLVGPTLTATSEILGKDEKSRSEKAEEDTAVDKSVATRQAIRVPYDEAAIQAIADNQGQPLKALASYVARTGKQPDQQTRVALLTGGADNAVQLAANEAANAKGVQTIQSTRLRRVKIARTIAAPAVMGFALSLLG